MSTEKTIRALIAKPGLDGHERGAKVVAYGLRDAGFEVIYTGLRQKPDDIATTAVHEDVDVVGLSVLSGAHLSLTRRVIAKLNELGAEDILVVLGGVIPDSDRAELKEMGVSGVFTAGTPILDIVEHIEQNISASGV